VRRGRRRQPRLEIVVVLMPFYEKRSWNIIIAILKVVTWRMCPSRTARLAMTRG
jgi:hypothetical protein